MVAKRIESEEDFDKLVSFVMRKTEGVEKHRCLCIDQASLQNDWNAICTQHRQLVYGSVNVAKGLSIAHILIPSKPKETSERISILTERKFEKLLFHFNSLGWSTMFAWFWDYCEKQLRALQPTALEEYTLQAIFEDYEHQVFSVVLKNERKELIEAIDGAFRAEDEQDGRTMMSHEKTMVIKRERIHELLAEQRKVIGRIVEGIKIIEEKHPELSGTKALGEKIIEVYDAPLTVEKMKDLGKRLGAVVVMD